LCTTILKNVHKKNPRSGNGFKSNKLGPTIWFNIDGKRIQVWSGVINTWPYFEDHLQEFTNFT
jgi:hypothetical protein